MTSSQGRFFRIAGSIVFAALCCAAAACGSSSSNGGSSSPVTSTMPATTTTTPPATTTTTTTSTSSSTTVQNLVATAAVKSALLAAGAKSHNLSASDYTGLVKGKTYYAYDPSTKTYWAGAALVAKPGDMQAEVGDQDDGAYLVFKQPTGGVWTAYPAGVTGADSKCMVTPPAAVDAIWGWAAKSCHPRNE